MSDDGGGVCSELRELVTPVQEEPLELSKQYVAEGHT